MAEHGEGLHVQLHFVGEALDVEFVEDPAGAEPGVVHHEIDRRLGRHDALDSGRPTLGCEQIGFEHLEAVVPSSNLGEPIAAACHQHRRHARLTQQPGHLGADPG